MFTSAEPPVDPGQGVERKQIFSPPVHFWYLISLVLVSHHRPVHGVPAKMGEKGDDQGRKRALGGTDENSEM